MVTLQVVPRHEFLLNGSVEGYHLVGHRVALVATCFVQQADALLAESMIGAVRIVLVLVVLTADGLQELELLAFEVTQTVNGLLCKRFFLCSTSLSRLPPLLVAAWLFASFSWALCCQGRAGLRGRVLLGATHLCGAPVCNVDRDALIHYHLVWGSHLLCSFVIVIFPLTLLFL